MRKLWLGTLCILGLYAYTVFVLTLLTPQRSQAITTRAGKGAPLSAAEYDGMVNQVRLQTYGWQVAFPTDNDGPWNRVYHSQACTVQEIQCMVNDGTSAVLALYESNANGSFTDLATNGIDGTTTITCGTTTTADDGTLSNAGIAAGRWVGFDIGAVVGTPEMLSVSYVCSID